MLLKGQRSVSGICRERQRLPDKSVSVGEVERRVKGSEVQLVIEDLVE